MVSNCSEKVKEYPVKSSGWGIIFRLAATNEKTQKNACFCAIFMKCLKCPETCANKIWDKLEHFKILMRAYARVEVRAQNLLTFFVDLWPEVDVYQIWLIFDDSLSRCDNDLIFTKWRLDDVTMTPWPWKRFRELDIIGPDDWQKWEGNWPSRFRVNVYTKKCTEEIKKIEFLYNSN